MDILDPYFLKVCFLELADGRHSRIERCGTLRLRSQGMAALSTFYQAYVRKGRADRHRAKVKHLRSVARTSCMACP